MATTINITKQADGTWQGSFNSTGTRTIVQVERQENAPLYLNISADDGQHNVIYQPPKDFKNQILLIDIAEGALVTIVSHSAVTKAQYIASELDYYTKAETDQKISEIYSLEPVVVDTLPTASEDTMKKLYFVPKTGGGETGNVKEEYITVRTVSSGSGTEQDPYVYSYSWEKVGDTSTQLQADWNQTNTSSADFIKNKPDLVEELNDLSDVEISHAITQEISQQTYFEDAVEDYDGNTYDAVIIGDQVWMAENLRTTHYADGTSVQSYAYPNNDQDNKDTYGLLYSWDAVMNGSSASSSSPSGVQGIAPKGWHIPSGDEMSNLFGEKTSNTLASKEGWKSSNVQNSPGYNPNDNNEYLFNARPAGSSVSGYKFSECSVFWTTTNIHGTELSYLSIQMKYDITRCSFMQTSKTVQYSVRCICDLTPAEFRAQMSLKGKVLMNDGSKWTGGEIPAQQQSDWNQSDNTKVDYIKNKPTNVSSFTNDSGYITQETDPTVPSWAKAQSKPSYDYSEIQNTPTLPTSAQLLPAVTSSDNGKILIVDNGAWVTESIPVVDAVLYPNSNN